MYLFVCTGNTCRSPMAQALWQKRGHDAESAGLYALPGASASSGAIRAMEKYGVDLSAHRAKAISESAMQKADKIIAMTEQHALALSEQFPRHKGKILCMPIRIADPFGGDDDDYLACAQDIDRALGLL